MTDIQKLRELIEKARKEADCVIDNVMVDALSQRDMAKSVYALCDRLEAADAEIEKLRAEKATAEMAWAETGKLCDWMRGEIDRLKGRWEKLKYWTNHYSRDAWIKMEFLEAGGNHEPESD